MEQNNLLLYLVVAFMSGVLFSLIFFVFKIKRLHDELKTTRQVGIFFEKAYQQSSKRRQSLEYACIAMYDENKRLHKENQDNLGIPDKL